ncbi:MAG: nucleotidyltransferase family protein [Evtepia gabavorous]
MEAEDFSHLPDSGEGLSHRLYDAVQSADSLPALYQLVKTKRYPLARIRRLVLWAFGADRPGPPGCAPLPAGSGVHSQGTALTAPDENHRHSARDS